MQDYRIVIKSAKKVPVNEALNLLNEGELRTIATDIAIKNRTIQNTIKEKNTYKTLLVSMGMDKDNLIKYIMTCSLFNWKVVPNPSKFI